MSFTKKRYVIRSPKLNGAIIKDILLLLIEKGVSIDDLSYGIQQRMQLTYKMLKKYLVYLIDYDLITYNGQKKIFLIGDGGVDLLMRIELEKDISKMDPGDITITLEKEFYFKI
jgi:predicted transcriptional regulator